MRLVSWLSELGKDDGPLAGGKGANLGEMLRARLPVPSGFVVTTAAYRHFVAANNLQGEIERLAQTAAAGDMTALTSVAADIAALFANAAVPPQIASVARQRRPTNRGHASALCRPDEVSRLHRTKNRSVRCDQVRAMRPPAVPYHPQRSEARVP